MALLIRSLSLMLLGEVALWNFVITAASSSSDDVDTSTELKPQENYLSFDDQSARFINHLWYDYGGSLLTEEGRRKSYRKVFPILVTGFMILMSLMVPLGFQFMAMIGGKALLMSKMALVLASLQNFKRPPPVYPPPQPVPVAAPVTHLLDHHSFHDRYSPRVGVVENSIN